MDTIPAWQWALIIVSIILVIIFIMYGRQFIQKQYGWGTWSKTQTSLCTSPSMSCAQPGKRWEYQTCEPNPLTRRGCLNYDGVQTYATRQKQVECTLQCQISKWKINVSDCQAPDPCTPVPTGGVMGSQTVTYTCIPFDETGINACTTGGLVGFNDGQYQEVRVYEPGDVVTTTLPCITTCPVVTMPKKVPEHSHILDTYYRSSSRCITNLSNRSSILAEGYDLVARAPELDETILYEITPSQVRNGTLPEDVLNWPYIRYNGLAYQINLCRYMSDRQTYKLKLKLGWLSTLQTPNNCNTTLKYKDWKRQPSDFLFKTPLTWSDRPELKIVLMIAPCRRVSEIEIIAQVALIVNKAYVGWLEIDHGLPYWVQAQVNYTLPGKTTSTADLVRLRQVDREVTVLTSEGSEIWIPSPDAWLSGKNWRNYERLIFRGILHEN